LHVKMPGRNMLLVTDPGKLPVLIFEPIRWYRFRCFGLSDVSLRLLKDHPMKRVMLFSSDFSPGAAGTRSVRG
jgi:hypothetical protein